MANKLYDEDSVKAIADAIREEKETEDTYTISEMAPAIKTIYPRGNIIVTSKEETTVTITETGDSYTYLEGETEHTFENIKYGQYTLVASKEGYNSISKIVSLSTPSYSLSIKASIVPIDYTELEYIESTGTQYIDTGIKKGSGTDTYSSKLTNIVDGYFTESQSKGFVGGYDSGGQLGQTSGLWSVETVVSTISALRTTVIKQILDVADNKDTLYHNNSSICYRTVSQPTYWTYNYYLFTARNGNGSSNIYYPGKFRLYSFKMYLDDSTEPVRDYVPAKRNSDGELGLYDIVNDKFYTNIGTGAFIPGDQA